MLESNAFQKFAENERPPEEPVFDEGDVFRITVPLDESLGGKEEENPTQGKCVAHKVSDLDKRILAAIEEKPSI